MLYYSIILFVCAIVLLFFGVLLISGKTDLIISHHIETMDEINIRKFSKILGISLIVLCVIFVVCGGMIFINEEIYLQIISIVLLVVSIFTVIIANLIILKKLGGQVL